MGLRTWFGLKHGLSFETFKRWPPDLAEHHSDPILTFGIPLRSSRSCADWKRVSELLQHTLDSVFRQSDPRYRVLICGHEFPNLPELADRRVELIRTKWSPPPTKGFQRDKHLKRFVMGLRLRSLGGGFFMQLDADDLVHKDLAAAALAPGRERGCIIARGYALDYANKIIAPVPGAWPVELDRICGSTAIVYYEPDEIPDEMPTNPRASELRTSHKFADDSTHPSVWQASAEYGKPLVALPFPAVIYVVNTSENISFVRERKGLRADGVPAMIRAHRICSSDQLAEIDAAFGTSLEASGRSAHRREDRITKRGEFHDAGL